MKKPAKFEAVILGADVNGLGQVRGLGRMNLRSFVVCADRGRHNTAISSRYCSAFYTPKKEKIHEAELLDLLCQLSKEQTQKRVLFASSDYFVNFMAANRSKLTPHYLFNLPDKDVVSLLTDKARVSTFAGKCGVPVPKTMFAENLDSLEDAGSLINYPFIIKPCNSYAVDFPGKNKIVYSLSEWRRFLSEYPDLKDQIVLQEIIPGGEENIFQCTAYIGKNVPVQFFTMKKIRQFPVGYGITSLGTSFQDSLLVSYASKLLQEFGFTGFASVEFKKSASDGVYYFVEVNPRLPWYNAMFTAAGVNFPQIAYQDLTTLPTTPNEQKKGIQQVDNVSWMHFKYELRGFWQRHSSGRSKMWFDYFRKNLKSRSFAYFDWYDPKPFLRASLDLFRWAFLKLFQRQAPY